VTPLQVGALTPVRLVLARLAGVVVLRRLARAALLSFALMCIAFGLLRLIPGDPVLILLGQEASAENVAVLRHTLGLEGNIAQQFVEYLTRLTRGDLGRSISTGESVVSLVARTLPVSGALIALTVLMAVGLFIPLGMAAAIYRRTPFYNVFRVVTSILIAMPIFFSGLILLLILALTLKLAPVAGYSPNFPTNLYYLWLPAFVICLLLVPLLARVLQKSISETLTQDFVEAAIVRGLPRGTLFWSYLLRPSLAPTVGLLGYIIGNLLSATVFVELIFDIPGVGRSLIGAVLNRDYPVVQGIVLIFGTIVVSVSFLSELLSGWLDPRTRMK
jgi:ABC-type dipeptide/oligopeptide/nickel transport system permease component